MTSPIGCSRTRNNDPGPTGAFTLIELILVMAILTMVIALVTPKLSRFFEGRSLDSETGRLVSLTRYAQSRAASEGIPMLLWINPRAGSYGLQQEPGYTDADLKAAEYGIGEGLKLDVAKGSPPSRTAGKPYAIHFSPDGTISPTSVKSIFLGEEGGAGVWIVQSGDRLSYGVQN